MILHGLLNSRAHLKRQLCAFFIFIASLGLSAMERYQPTKVDVERFHLLRNANAIFPQEIWQQILLLFVADNSLVYGHDIDGTLKEAFLASLKKLYDFSENHFKLEKSRLRFCASVLQDNFNRRGIDLETLEEKWRGPAVHHACKMLDLKSLKILCCFAAPNEYEFVARQDHLNMTALHAAAENGFTEGVDELLEMAGTNVAKFIRIRPYYGITPLHQAARKGNVVIIEKLMKAAQEGIEDYLSLEYDENKPIADVLDPGYNALHNAIMGGHLKATEVILEKARGTDLLLRKGERCRNVLQLVMWELPLQKQKEFVELIIEEAQSEIATLLAMPDGRFYGTSIVDWMKMREGQKDTEAVRLLKAAAEKYPPQESCVLQ
jgi:ankyrin repeat protein